jgi:pyruvate/2-oxoglutarate dehydrogenase complex dihydrolipoamide acyltransferase (E2) component
MKEVSLPAVGVAMTEGLLVRWYRQAGEQVHTGDPLAEVETDKTTIDIEAPVDGRVGRLRVAEGSEVPAGAVLTVILEGDEDEPVEEGGT